MKYKVITAIDSQDLEDKLNQYPEYTVYSTTIHHGPGGCQQACRKHSGQAGQ